MGAHVNGSSKLTIDGKENSLHELIQQYPKEFLGKQLIDQGIKQLPYLFKLLAIEKPLSIQVHPPLDIAVKEYEIENQQQISITAPNRNYRDPNHKPELAIAVDNLKALCNFEKDVIILNNLRSLRIQEVNEIADQYEQSKNKKQLVENILNLRQQPNFSQIMQNVVKKSMQVNGICFNELIKASQFYEEDAGLLFFLVLKLYLLRQGQGLYLQPGIIHAYVSGTAVEIMANSDNVLRCGLTPKHIDQKQLLSVIDDKVQTKVFEAGQNIQEFDCGLNDFKVLKLENSAKEYKSEYPGILFVYEGDCELTSQNEKISIKKGQSVYIIPNEQTVHIQCPGLAFLASTGQQKFE